EGNGEVGERDDRIRGHVQPDQLGPPQQAEAVRRQGRGVQERLQEGPHGSVSYRFQPRRSHADGLRGDPNLLRRSYFCLAATSASIFPNSNVLRTSLTKSDRSRR